MQLKATYTLNIFIAYHPSDKAQFEELQTHLEDLNKKNIGYTINRIWYDGTNLSEENRVEIYELAQKADLILLLMSDESILSPFFISKELREILLEQDQESNIIVPIILSSCWWEDTVFRKLEVLPKAGLPIYDSSNIKNELFDQVVEQLDKKLEKVRARKRLLEDNFNLKIQEAEAIFGEWQKKPEGLRTALSIYEKALSSWKEGFVPNKKNIEARIFICYREIDFKHYAKAAHEAYKKKDYQTCFFNCVDALDLRDDALVRRLHNIVKQHLDEEELDEKRAPFDKHLKAGHDYFLTLQWEKAKEQYLLALEFHQEKFVPTQKVIEHKIEICKREYTLENSLKEAQANYKVQNYHRMAKILLDAIKSINHEAFYKVDHAIKLIGYLEKIEAYRDTKIDRWGFYDKDDKTVIIAPKYTAAYNFTENLAGVKKWEKWGFIDVEGNEVIPFIYSYVSHFQNGIAQVILKNESFCINHQNERVEADIIEIQVPIDTPSIR